MKLFLHGLQNNELKDFKKLTKKIIAFLVPCLIIFLINFIIDPFNLNRLVTISYNKKEIACQFNERLWKLNEFTHHPKKNIILGDSRAARISEQQLKTITGNDFVNMALSGATLTEIIDTFRFIVSKHTPQEIIICINFDRFNDWQKSQFVQEAINELNNTLIHYIKPQTCKAASALILSLLFNKKTPNIPPMNRDSFWHYQLEEVDNAYKRYVFPLYVSRELSQIADYCKNNAIKLSFLILPNHSDFQKRINEAQLSKQELHFKKFLTSLAPVYDLDIENEFTQNKNNFDDPKHVTYEATKRIISQIWGSQRDQNLVCA